MLSLQVLWMQTLERELLHKQWSNTSPKLSIYILYGPLLFFFSSSKTVMFGVIIVPCFVHLDSNPFFVPCSIMIQSRKQAVFLVFFYLLGPLLVFLFQQPCLVIHVQTTELDQEDMKTKAGYRWTTKSPDHPWKQGLVYFLQIPYVQLSSASTKGSQDGHYVWDSNSVIGFKGYAF